MGASPLLSLQTAPAAQHHADVTSRRRGLAVACLIGETFSELRSVVSPHHDEAAQWIRYSHLDPYFTSFHLGRARDAAAFCVWAPFELGQPARRQFCRLPPGVACQFPVGARVAIWLSSPFIWLFLAAKPALEQGFTRFRPVGSLGTMLGVRPMRLHRQLQLAGARTLGLFIIHGRAILGRGGLSRLWGQPSRPIEIAARRELLEMRCGSNPRTPARSTVWQVKISPSPWAATRSVRVKCSSAGSSGSKA